MPKKIKKNTQTEQKSDGMGAWEPFQRRPRTVMLQICARILPNKTIMFSPAFCKIIREETSCKDTFWVDIFYNTKEDAILFKFYKENDPHISETATQMVLNAGKMLIGLKSLFKKHGINDRFDNGAFVKPEPYKDKHMSGWILNLKNAFWTLEEN